MSAANTPSTGSVLILFTSLGPETGIVIGLTAVHDNRQPFA